MAAAPAARRPTEARLRRRALFYLERFATTKSHLRKVLLRRALREAGQTGLDPAEVRRAVDRVVERLSHAGLIDDASYAVMQARRLLARGSSLARVRARLAEKGVGPKLVEGALRALREEMGDPALAAAWAFARRRRLGPYRPLTEREEMRERDLAAFARAGFSYDAARRVLEAEAVPDPHGPPPSD